MTAPNPLNAKWPDDAQPDGILYSLECDRATRAVMADDDTSAENCALDEDGAFIWVPTTVDEYLEERPDLPPVTGTYRYVSEVAAKLNLTQSRIGKVGWVYSPAPIERLAA